MAPIPGQKACLGCELGITVRDDDEMRRSAVSPVDGSFGRAAKWTILENRFDHGQDSILALGGRETSHKVQGRAM